MVFQRLRHALGKPVAVDGEGGTGGDFMRIAHADDERVGAAHFFVKQTDGASGIVRAEGVGANQLRAIAGMVRLGLVGGTHLVDDDIHAEIGRLPRRFATGKASADDIEDRFGHGMLIIHASCGV